MPSSTWTPQHPTSPATKIIATIDRFGRVFAIQGNNEQYQNHGLEFGYTLLAYSVATKIQPGQMANTVVEA